MFTGQGSQSVGMGRGLLRQPRFRAHMRHWCEALSDPREAPLFDAIYGHDASEETLAQTQNAQRALFALEVSLASIWMEAGLQPGAVIGHSIGELGAAHIAGMMTADDAAKLVVARAALMGLLPGGGGMLAVRASENSVRSLLGADTTIAAVNGRESVVLSGRRDEMERAERLLEDGGVAVQALKVSHAFHSAAIDPILEPLRAAAKDVAVVAPKIPLASNVTGRLVTSALSPDYWVEQARRAVRFAAGLEALHAAGFRDFLEIGPAPILARLGRRAALLECRWWSTLDPPNDDLESVQRTAAALSEDGFEVEPGAFAASPAEPGETDTDG